MIEQNETLLGQVKHNLNELILMKSNADVFLTKEFDNLLTYTSTLMNKLDLDKPVEDCISIPKEQAIRMYKLFGDIEHTLDENNTIHPDTSAAKGWGANHASKEQLAKDKYTIHQRVSWMTSGYGCHIGDNKPDWTI